MAEHATIAFDGLSLAGKSTLAQMLVERSPNAVIVSENQLDPLRPTTSRLNKLFKESPTIPYAKALERLVIQTKQDPEHKRIAAIAEAAQSYVKQQNLIGPDLGKYHQATLAYFFAAGRALVYGEIKSQAERSDLIFDRWKASGAYQTQPPVNGLDDTYYPWWEIMRLNDAFGIPYPDLQVIVTCPVEEIPLRRQYRQKEGSETLGQMSNGREQTIHTAFEEMITWLFQKKVHMIYLQNEGVPKSRLDDQIQQAIPAYLRFEESLRATIKAAAAENIGRYQIVSDPFKHAEDAAAFFFERPVLDRIYQRQTAKR